MRLRQQFVSMIPSIISETASVGSLSSFLLTCRPICTGPDMMIDEALLMNTLSSKFATNSQFAQRLDACLPQRRHAIGRR
jgi:hypothetical protein